MMDVKCVVCGEPWDFWGLKHGDVLAWEYDLFKKGAGCPSCKGEGSSFDPESIEDFENGDEDPMERIEAYVNAQTDTAPEWKPPEPEVLRTCGGCGIQLVRDLAEEVYDGDERKPVYAWKVPILSNAAKWYISHSERNMGDPEEAFEDHVWQPWSRMEVTFSRTQARANDIVTGIQKETLPTHELLGWLEKHQLKREDVTLREVGRDDVACPCCYQKCNDCGEVAIATVTELEPDDIYGLGASLLPAGRHHACDAVCVDCYEERCSTCGDRDCDCCTCDAHGGEPHEGSSECCDHAGEHLDVDDEGDCRHCGAEGVDEEE